MFFSSPEMKFLSVSANVKSYAFMREAMSRKFKFELEFQGLELKNNRLVSRINA